MLKTVTLFLCRHQIQQQRNSSLKFQFYSNFYKIVNYKVKIAPL